ncbi:MAG: hypothetical protein FWD47_05480 [Treponema sp.]|nr:hypothetical protein [Treponema sp.]
MINDSVAFRRKDFREASDSGILLWRQNFVTFLPFFAIPLWICAFIPRIILPGNYQYLSWLIIWFLKPLFDRIILHIISIRFFDKDANFKRLLKGLWKTLLRGLLGDLTWRRFSPIRSVMMPVRVLEQNIKSRKRFAQRKNNLKKGGIGYCFLLTIWGIAVEIALLFGGYIFFLMINQIMFGGNIHLEVGNREIYVYAAWCINYMLIESLYVCMGFSVYINSRIDIEGWDLEITFRNLAENYKNKSKYTVLAVLLLTFLFFPVKSHADDQVHENNNIPIDALQTILDSPDFGEIEYIWSVRPKNQNDEINENRKEYYFPWHLRELIAKILMILLIILFTGFAIFLFIYFYRNKSYRTKSKNSYNATFLKDINTVLEPKLLLENALRFHEMGNIRLAWGYCTAAAIYSWSAYQNIIFHPNTTENECAALVNSKNDTAQAKEFSKLIKHWIHLAYAGRLPPDGSFEQAITHCYSLRAENE